MIEYNLNYLSALEIVKTNDYERTHATYRDLETKSFQVSATLLAFYAAIFAAVFFADEGWGDEEVYFLATSLPGVLASIYYTLQTIKNRPYVESMKTVFPPKNLTEIKYFLDRIEFLKKSIDINSESNSRKAKAIGLAVSSFISALISFVFVWILSLFFNNFWNEATLVALLISFVAGTLIFFATKHIVSSKKTWPNR